jgi:hypothetical protein
MALTNIEIQNAKGRAKTPGVTANSGGSLLWRPRGRGGGSLQKR